MLCDFSKVLKISNRISNSDSLCKRILDESGFAMLPGSDFGIDENHLISRIAFVDFNGEKALKLVKKTTYLSDDFLKKACPNILNGVNSLIRWIQNNSS